MLTISSRKKGPATGNFLKNLFLKFSAVFADIMRSATVTVPLPVEKAARIKAFDAPQPAVGQTVQ